jgi:hypothetical protein
MVFVVIYIIFNSRLRDLYKQSNNNIEEQSKTSPFKFNRVSFTRTVQFFTILFFYLIAVVITTILHHLDLCHNGEDGVTDTLIAIYRQ